MLANYIAPHPVLMHRERRRRAVRRLKVAAVALLAAAVFWALVAP